MKEPSTARRGHDELRITHDRVVDAVVRIIRTRGLEAAQERFEVLNEMFCTELGWPTVAKRVYDIIGQERRRLHDEQLKEELAMRKAGAPSYYILNQNEATAEHKVGQLNNWVETGANVYYKKKN